MSVKELLLKYNIPIQTWGQGNAKTLADLEKEIAEKESALEEDNGRLFRRTTNLYVDIYCFHPITFETLKLREDRQEFKDGRIRRRRMKGSLAEKMKPGEERDDAVYRAIKEELGIPSEGVVQFIINTWKSWEEEIDSPAFPGLTAKFECYKVNVEISPVFFNEEGYKEVQKDKTTYFVWQLTSDY